MTRTVYNWKRQDIFKVRLKYVKVWDETLTL